MLEENLIRDHYTFLVENCKSNLILHKLQASLPLSMDEYHELDEIKDRKQQCRQLLNYLMNRDLQAFDAFKKALYETQQNAVLQRLDSTYKYTPVRLTQVFKQPDNITVENISEQERPLDILVKYSSNFDYEHKFPSIPIYDTTSAHRGLVKIINVYSVSDEIDTKPDRRGSHIDVQNLDSLFTQMGFTVEVVNNDPTKSEIEHEIRSFVSDKRLRHSDIAILFVMSHGGVLNNQEYIYGSDHVMLYTRWIEKQFSNENCRLMLNKPKMLFFQACRGEQPDYGVAQRVETDGVPTPQMDIPINEPTTSDLLIANSTCPETASHRDRIVGTWFIYLLCKVFMNHAHERDVLELMTMVHSKLRQERSHRFSMQTGECLVRAFNKCYLNPGIYRGDNNQVCFFNI